MDWNEIMTHVLSFIFGGAAGSLITIKYRSNSSRVQQKNINVTNGDVVGRDKN